MPTTSVRRLISLFKRSMGRYAERDVALMSFPPLRVGEGDAPAESPVDGRG